MTDSQIQKFEDLILKAVQSGKKETSDLVDMVIHKIEPAIENSVNKYVNGKLDKMNLKIDDYIVSDLQWKERAEPTLQMGQNVAGFGRVLLYIVGFVASVAGAIIAVIKLVNGK